MGLRTGPRVVMPGWTLLVIMSVAAGQDRAIDVDRSTITIHVDKAGLLSAAGHEHWVAAPISSGTIRESPSGFVEFTVQTAQMMVKPDPKVEAKTQAEIQKDMEDLTLETRKFPQITFRSSRVNATGDGRWRVEGDLSLHGVTKPVTLTVKRTGDAYTAHTVLKQTDFAIKPVSVGGGLVKVKNEVEIDFQIFAQVK
ncbi:MAG TPA: YceI family protein [Bryobacteraceae bacterium]|nr:YceI family protein [Bryobacteraceae bacterium]